MIIVNIFRYTKQLRHDQRNSPPALGLSFYFRQRSNVPPSNGTLLSSLTAAKHVLLQPPTPLDISLLVLTIKSPAMEHEREGLLRRNSYSESAISRSSTPEPVDVEATTKLGNKPRRFKLPRRTRLYKAFRLIFLAAIMLF